MDRTTRPLVIIAAFAGSYLSEPKPNVFFDPPLSPLAPAAFRRQAGKRGVALHAKSRLLFVGTRFYINGEAFSPARDEQAALRVLADSRTLPAPFPASLFDRFYDWYEAGWLEIPA